MITVYYAHHLLKYNTKEELREIQLIKDFYKNVNIINPNGYVDQNKSEPSIMDDCFEAIKKTCDELVFSTIEDGIIGKGVYDEIKCALDDNKKVYLINNNELIKFTMDDYNNIQIIYNITLTKRKYAKVVK